MAEETPRSASREAAGVEAAAQPAAAAPRDAAGDAPSAVGAIAANAAADPPTTPTPKRNDIAQLLDFAGGRKPLTYVGLAISAISQLLGFVPYVCIWLVARNLIEVAPNWQAAQGIAAYGWWAIGGAIASIAAYFLALMCTHLAAFRAASNMRKQTTEHLMRLPLGFFDGHATGELRRVIDGCAASTESLLAHVLPDAAGSIAMVVGMLALLFTFDWRLGLACLVPVAISICCLMTMMSGKGMEFMKSYMGALVRMNETGTEYVRGIPVVKVFQQTVYSFKAFHDAIADYARMAQDYAGTFCRKPQVFQLSVLNGLVVFLLPVALILAPGEADFPRFVADFAFYAIFSAVIPTAMAKLMFMSEASQMAGDSLGRVCAILEAKPLETPANPQPIEGGNVRFEHVSFAYEGTETNALDDVSFEVPAGTTLALAGFTCRAAKCSASPLPVRSSRTRPSWCSTRPRRLPIPRTRPSSNARSRSWPRIVR